MFAIKNLCQNCGRLGANTFDVRSRSATLRGGARVPECVVWRNSATRVAGASAGNIRRDFALGDTHNQGGRVCLNASPGGIP